MSEDEVKRIVQDAYRARANEDYQGLRRLFSENVVFRVAGDPQASPVAVSTAGIDAFVQAVRGLVETFEFLAQDEGDWVIGADKASVRFAVRIKHLPSGTLLDTEVVDLWRLRDGRIAEFVQFVDTAVIARLMASG